MKLNFVSFIILDLFLCLLVIFMVQAAPPPKPESAKPGPAAITIELYWDMADDADVDLWAIAPGESRAVGYSSRQGEVLSLLRDDLGRSGSKDSRNYEIIQAFGYHAGLWVADAHLYRFRSGPMPVSVHLIVSRRRPNGDQETLLDIRAQLVAPGEELTLARFQMDDQGNIVPGTFDNIPTPLRSQ